jgi:hypothetical protein
VYCVVIFGVFLCVMGNEHYVVAVVISVKFVVVAFNAFA